jgi:hypothetical protein
MKWQYRFWRASIVVAALVSAALSVGAPDKW